MNEYEEVMYGVKWTKDCQDKWNYDFPIIKVSTRYYGRDNSAIPAIIIGDTVVRKTDGYIYGKTESDCKRSVEVWVEREVKELISYILKFYEGETK